MEYRFTIMIGGTMKQTLPEKITLKLNQNPEINLFTHHSLPLLIPVSEEFDYWRLCNFINIFYHFDYPTSFDYTDYHITEKKIIEKEISETDLDHIKSGPNELVIGNFWIFKGKITILKSSLFPIDPFIIMYTAILMEIIFWIKAKISRFRENKSSKSVVITGGDEIGS